MEFIVLTTQRSGSTFFIQYLDSHPEVSCQGELFLDVKHNFRLRSYLKWKYRFKRKFTKNYMWFQNYLRTNIWRQIEYTFLKKRLTEKFLSNIYSTDGCNKAIGFKLMYNQNNRIISNWLKRNNVAIIHLVRLNLLKILISRIYMAEKNIAHTSKVIKHEKICLETKYLIQKLTRMENEINENKNRFSSFPRYLEITYEDFFNNRDFEQQKILHFLGVKESSSLHSELKKINPNRIEDILENYEEVRLSLTGTKFISFLE